MTAPRDPDARISAFLEEGLTDLPDRAFDAVRRDIHRTRQRAAIGSWRQPHMTSIARVAIAAAAVVIVTLVLVNLTRSGSSGPGAPSLSPSPSPSSEPSPSLSTPTGPPAYAWPQRLAAGTYVTSLIWGPDLVFRFTVPEGWDSRDIEVIKGDRMALQFYVIENLVADTCSETLAEPPVGTSPDGIAAGLAKLVSISDGPRPVTVGDRSGTYVEFTVGPELGCAPSEFRLMKLAPGSCGAGCGGLGPPFKGLESSTTTEHNRLWIFSVGRGHVIMNAIWTPDATPVDLAELQAVIDSAQFETPNATPPPQPASLEP